MGGSGGDRGPPARSAVGRRRDRLSSSLGSPCMLRRSLAARMPGDLVSPGWTGMMGLGLPFYGISETTLLVMLKPWAGGPAVRPATARLVGPWRAPRPVRQPVVYRLHPCVAMFARQENFYWMATAGARPISAVWPSCRVHWWIASARCVAHAPRPQADRQPEHERHAPFRRPSERQSRDRGRTTSRSISRPGERHQEQAQGRDQQSAVHPPGAEKP